MKLWKNAMLVGGDGEVVPIGDRLIAVDGLTRRQGWQTAEPVWVNNVYLAHYSPANLGISWRIIENYSVIRPGT